MINLKLGFYSVIGLVSGIVLFVYGFVWLKQKRLIENLPTSKIRSIALGLVEIKGKVEPYEKRLLKSPFSKKGCVYYKYIIEKKIKTNKSSRWVTIKSNSKMQKFYLNDGTGKVLIDPEGANFDLKTKNLYTSSLLKDPPEFIKEFLKKNDIKFEDLFGINYNMRYKEYYIKPNETLFILGTALDNPFVKEGSSLKNEQDIMISKGSEHKKFFIISDKPEDKLIKNLNIRSGLSIFFGAVLIIIFIATFLKSINII